MQFSLVCHQKISSLVIEKFAGAGSIVWSMHSYMINEFPDDFLCSVEEVEHLLASVDPSKASGADLLSAKMLMATATSIAPAITSLFNLSLTQGQLPAEWKLACIMPIPKSQDKSDPANYRPISLLSILSKLLEKHVQSYILETCSPLSPNQWGFSRGKSTTGALQQHMHGI